MDVRQLEEMLKRRGYGMATTPIIEPSTGCIGTGYLATARGMRLAPVWSEIEHPHPDFKQAETTEEMAAYIDRVLGRGQHHMQCQCGQPVLMQVQSEVKEVVPWWRFPEPTAPEPTPFISGAYRLVSAGPESEPITICPQCGLPLSESVKEIEE